LEPGFAANDAGVRVPVRLAAGDVHSQITSVYLTAFAELIGKMSDDIARDRGVFMGTAGHTDDLAVAIFKAPFGRAFQCEILFKAIPLWPK
jgi:hypothetical protein